MLFLICFCSCVQVALLLGVKRFYVVIKGSIRSVSMSSYQLFFFFLLSLGDLLKLVVAKYHSYFTAITLTGHLSTAPAPQLTSQSIMHLYHMVIAVDGVYEFVMSDCELWRSQLKAWLLR